MNIAGPRALAAACLLGISAPGCGADPPPPTRSPTAEEDPARLEEALRVSEEIRIKTQKVEREAMKRFNLPRPPETPGAPRPRAGGQSTARPHLASNWSAVAIAGVPPPEPSHGSGARIAPDPPANPDQIAKQTNMMNLLKHPILGLAIVAAAGLAPTASAAIFAPGAAIVDPGLAGNTQYDGWLGLTAGNNPGYPGFPGTAPWPGPIGSNQAGSGDAGLIKTANGTGGAPYPASGSIYYGGFSGDVNNNGGTLAVTDSTPLANLSNLVFQIQIGEAWTYDFFNHALPTLSYNGGTQNLAATGSFVLEKFYNGTVTMPTGDEDVFINTYLLQWDLTGLAGTITDFAIQFTGVQHAQLYSLRLDQSDVYAPYGDVVATTPEPSTLALMGIGFAAIPLLRRFRKRG